jgi:hypothetical protein
MIGRRGLCLLAFAGIVGCGNSSSGVSNDGGTPDAHADVSPPPAEGGGHDTGGHDAGGDAGGATTTIAEARQGNVTTAITVDAFVTALAGEPKDYPNWYIEDPKGGPYSGVNVYCDPLATTPCNVPEPALHDLIQVTGKLTTYMGQVELIPTAMTVLESSATFPPIATVTAADIAPSADSKYRGVFVKLAIPSMLIVDSVTPHALADTACGAVLPVDAGAGEGGAKDGAASEAGLPQCTDLCEPPVYSGFRANDGTGNEVYVEAPFFYTDPLQSSPECLKQKGVVPVTVGMTFSEMSGILDIDPYSASQALSPVLPTDYVTP